MGAESLLINKRHGLDDLDAMAWRVMKVPTYFLVKNFVENGLTQGGRLDHGRVENGIVLEKKFTELTTENF